jgi:hypothetical protein
MRLQNPGRRTKRTLTTKKPLSNPKLTAVTFSQYLIENEGWHARATPFEQDNRTLRTANISRICVFQEYVKRGM